MKSPPKGDIKTEITRHQENGLKKEERKLE